MILGSFIPDEGEGTTVIDIRTTTAKFMKTLGKRKEKVLAFIIFNGYIHHMFYYFLSIYFSIKHK